MASNIVLMAGGKLKKELNIVTLIAAMIGLNIGGSLFVLTAISAGLTGPSLVIAQLISALPILLALVPYLMLTSAAPKTCANYQYAKLFSRPLAVAGWMGLFIAIPIGALPLFAIATEKLLAVIIPEVPIIWTAIGIMTIFFAINIIGVKAAAYVQLAAVVLLILALLSFIIPGLPAIDSGNFTPMFTGGGIGIIAASALLYTLLAGGLFGIELGDEIKNARITIPKALMISIPIVAVIYILIEIVAVGVIDAKVLAEGGTLGTAAKAFLSGNLLNLFIIGGGILASTTTINLTLTAAGRYVLVSAEDRFLPRFFSGINKRFGTPHWGLSLAYVLSIITLAFNPPLETMAAMLNFGLLFMVTLVLLAAVKLPNSHPEIYANSKYKFGKKTIAFTAITAIVINIVFMAILAVALPVAFLIFACAGATGVGLYYLRRRQLGFAPSYITIDQVAEQVSVDN